MPTSIMLTVTLALAAACEQDAASNDVGSSGERWAAWLQREAEVFCGCAADDEKDACWQYAQERLALLECEAEVIDNASPSDQEYADCESREAHKFLDCIEMAECSTSAQQQCSDDFFFIPCELPSVEFDNALYSCGPRVREASRGPPMPRPSDPGPAVQCPVRDRRDRGALLPRGLHVRSRRRSKC